MTNQNTKYRFVGDPTTEQSVSIDGVRLADFGVHLLADSAEPSLPETRDRTLTIPGRHGEYNFGGVMFGARTLDLSLGFNNQANLTDVQRLIRELNTLLLDEYGRPKMVKIIYDYEPDKHYNAQFSGSMPIERIANAGKFTLPMRASDPYAYSNIWNDGVTWGSEEITFMYDYILGDDSDAANEVSITHPQTLSLYNYGYAVKPEITIEGSASSMTVSANERSFQLPAFNNAKYVINGELFTVTKNGANAFNDLTGDFIEMLTGANEVSVSGSGLNVKMSVKYQFKYL